MMQTRHYDYYSYQDLEKIVLSGTAEQIDIDTLGGWFEQYGSLYWNGESYEINSEFRLWPVYSEPDEYEDVEILGYELRRA